MRFGVVCGRFNDLITNRLLDGVSNGFAVHGVREADVTVVWVPGAFEIPITAKTMADDGQLRRRRRRWARSSGATPPHFDYVAGECARGIQEAQLATGVPIVFGVLTTENLEQALERSGRRGQQGRGVGPHRHRDGRPAPQAPRHPDPSKLASPRANMLSRFAPEFGWT